jgi:hypothetical protein
VARGNTRDSRLFFFHRQASDDHNLEDADGLRAALREASGPAAAWSDLDSILALRQDPKADLAYWERVWLNRPTQAARQAFSSKLWAKRPRLDYTPEGLQVVGVDGARFRDALAMIATEVESGHQSKVGIWERPRNAEEDYEHPFDEIDEVMIDFFERSEIWRVYVDPQWIDELVKRWQRRWGEDRIREWHMHRPRPAAALFRNYKAAIVGGDLTHDGDAVFARHIGNARRRNLGLRDDEGEPLWVIEKERRDSLKLIDAAAAGGLSWEARGDALATGAKSKKSGIQFF